MLLCLLELLGCPDLAAHRRVLSHVVLLGLQLQVHVALLLTDLERIESISLKLGSPVKVHIFESHGASQSHSSRTSVTSLFDASHLGLFTLVLGTLQLLMLFEHGNFVVCIGCPSKGTTLRGALWPIHRLPHVGRPTSRVSWQLVARSDWLVTRVQEIINVCVICLSITSEIHSLRTWLKSMVNTIHRL